MSDHVMFDESTPGWRMPGDTTCCGPIPSPYMDMPENLLIYTGLSVALKTLSDFGLDGFLQETVKTIKLTTIACTVLIC